MDNNSKKHECAIEQSAKAVKAIIMEYPADMVRDHEIPTLVNPGTGETIALCVIQLSTKYDYDDQIFRSWQEMLHADSWYINVRQNRLFVHFKVKYKNDN